MLGSPRSVSSKLDIVDVREKAERVLDALVSLLSSSQECYTKFTSSLPLTRICLLLLEDKPSPFIAEQVLNLIITSLDYSLSFSRKFELVSGWAYLKTVLPGAWSPGVQAAVFKVLLGKDWDSQSGDIASVSCPYIISAILASLERVLNNVLSPLDVGGTASGDEALCGSFLETLINLQSTSPTFRDLFKSHQTTQLFVQAFKTYLNTLSVIPEIHPSLVRILEKLMHFGLTLALDPVVAGGQKREVNESCPEDYSSL